MISTIMIGDGGREDSLRWKLEKESINKLNVSEPITLDFLTNPNKNK